MNKPTVSLCMIVKNEEDVIARCLESVKNHVDEIIIVDTGSTDKTKEVLSNYDVKLYEFAWNDNFSDARNFAKDKATMDWILQLDADEYFLKGEAEKLKQEIEKTKKNSLSIQITNLVRNNEKGAAHTYARLFKNLPEIQYNFAIHEQVFMNGESVETEITNIRIMHTGYTTETYKRKNKNARNMKMIQNELKKNPTNSFMLFNMGNEYSTQEKYDKALEFYKKAYKHSEGKGVAFAIVQNIIKTLIRLNRKDEALKIIHDAKLIYQDYTDIFYFEAEILEEKGFIEDAKRAYEKCLELGEANKKYLTVKGVGTIYPREKLVSLYIKERNFQKAMEHLLFLIEMNKYNELYVRNLISVLRRTFGEEKIVEYLDGLYNEEDPRDLYMKLYVVQMFRMEKGIFYYYEKIKGTVHDNEALKNDFYINLFSLNHDKAAELAHSYIDKYEKNKVKLAFIYYLFTKDSVIKEKLVKNKTSKMIMDALEGTYEKGNKKKNHHHALYIDILKELMYLQQYDAFEKMLLLQEEFQPIVYKEIAELFYKNLNDELAMEYFIRYLNYDKNNHKIHTKVSGILYTLEMYEEAILFAHRAFSLNQKYFQPIEVLIKSYQSKGEKDASSQIIKEAMDMFPDSTYLKEQKEYNF